MDIDAHNRKGYNGKQLKKTEFCIVAVQRMGEKQMKIRERGVLAESEIYFHTPSEMARRMFFYLRCTGRYLCDETYAVQRQSYNSFLILYVVRGQGCRYVDDERVPCPQGTLRCWTATVPTATAPIPAGKSCGFTMTACWSGTIMRLL